MHGIITNFNTRGFGFVRISGSQTESESDDIFFHVSEVTFPEDQLKRRLPVEFDLGKHRGNTVARNIRLLQSGADDERQ